MIITQVDDLIVKNGGDILNSERFISQKNFLQHGKTTTFDHTVNVARLSLSLAEKIKLKVDVRALIRGALLHDYYLYDWHKHDKKHRFHGLTHPGLALKQATADFEIGVIECDIIKKHMFPLNLIPPRYKEGFIVSFADKVCAVCETFSLKSFNKKYGFSINY